MNQSELNELACRVLVKSGYADGFYDGTHDVDCPSYLMWTDDYAVVTKQELIRYYYTGTDLEKRGMADIQRQDLIEYFTNHGGVAGWGRSEYHVGFATEGGPLTNLQWTIARINWCLEQVANTELMEELRIHLQKLKAGL